MGTSGAKEQNREPEGIYILIQELKRKLSLTCAQLDIHVYDDLKNAKRDAEKRRVRKEEVGADRELCGHAGKGGL